MSPSGGRKSGTGGPPSPGSFRIRAAASSLTRTSIGRNSDCSPAAAVRTAAAKESVKWNCWASPRRSMAPIAVKTGRSPPLVRSTPAACWNLATAMPA
ncbi:hypothetical protein ACWV95_03250 [Streptomyces albus]